ncbi:MAG: HAMP domain-containing sensor histidine kinase [Bacteroidales bacterium]|nr:HAMP domain-containing sensor histidine kinase [Bacteroidales bacterium]
MDINILTIIYIINSGISLIMGFIMLFQNRYSIKLGTGYWASGALIIGVGFLLKALFPINNLFNFTELPILFTIGLYLYLAGIWKFKDKKFNYWILIGIPILDVLQTVIFYFIFPSVPIQSGIHYVVLIVYFLLAIFEMIRLNSDQKYLKKIFLLNAFAFAISLVFMLFLFYILITAPIIEPLQATNAAIITFIVNGFIMISLTFGFLTAVNIRLTRELTGQLKSNSKFLSIIAHDLRGPVGTITNFLELLQNETELNEDERKIYLNILSDLSQSTFHLLQNLLEWGTKSKNINNFKNERIELTQIITVSMDFFKSAAFLKSIDIKFTEDDKTYILGDSNMLQTIVRNLISNAIKYTPKGGTIEITTKNTSHKVRLTISDTGQGMKPEAIDSFFKFETNSSTMGTNGEVGSGIGLVLCKELTSRMNGIIVIESDVGVGTKVIIDFPLI